LSFYIPWNPPLTGIQLENMKRNNKGYKYYEEYLELLEEERVWRENGGTADV
jgi:hypothetical protein